jgi:hypothetical protein
MKLLQSLAACAVAAVSVSTPALARVEPGTTQLLQTLTDYGVTIQYNPPSCNGRFKGRYNTHKIMTLCYQGVPTASDFDTVRHETWHFLQHCAELNRGGNLIAPLAQNSTKRTTWVTKVLNPSSINQIKRNYPEAHHQIELEAFAAAQHYTATDLINYIQVWCRK